jgi:hypothetical protein
MKLFKYSFGRYFLVMLNIFLTSFPGFWQIKSVKLSAGNEKISFQNPAPEAYGCHLYVGSSKTFQITKTFHVAMLQRYKGFWDSAELLSGIFLGKYLNLDVTSRALTFNLRRNKNGRF